MRKTFWDKRIPSFLGLLFLAISVGIISWFGKSYTELRTKASVGEIPNQLQISNITDTSFTVSYTTQERVTGAIIYGRDSKLGQVRLDDRDAGKPSARQVHYITISGLEPATNYYFAVQSAAVELLNNNEPYKVRTANNLSESTATPVSVTGNVNLPDGTIPMDGIVYLSASLSAASQLLSTPFKPDGTYLLPLGSLRASDLTSYFNLDSDTILQITILNASSQSRISVKAGHANPVPLVTLSRDYDFISDTSFTAFTASQSAPLSEASPSGTLSPGAPSSGFPSFPENTESSPDIITPQDEEEFIDQQPLFQGTASPNAIVVIIIESTQEIRTSVEADNSGNWQFRPTEPLSPGQHTITIHALDASGVKQTIKRSFTVFAEGSKFTEPSVSPTFSPTPTPVSSSPTVTPKPTSSPTVILTPTLTPTTPVPTLAPTITPTPVSLQSPTPVVTVTPTPFPIAAPGSSSLLIGGFLAALSLTAGFMLFFFL